MAKKEVHPVIVIGAIVVILGFVGFAGFKAMTPPQPSAGSYTPGVPPWLDKSSANYGKTTGTPVAPGTRSPGG